VADPDAFDDPNLYLEMRSMQKIRLDLKYSYDARRLFMSKLLRKPLRLMQDRVNSILNHTDDVSSLRYMIYSAHDDHVINMVEFLHSENIEAPYADYATNVVFELHYDDECVAGAQADEECFSVETLWNGQLMGFRECATRKDSVGRKCTLPQFKEHMRN